MFLQSGYPGGATFFSTRIAAGVSITINPGRARRRHPPLAADEANNKGNAGQVTRAENDAQDPPEERGAQGNGCRSFDGMTQRREKLFHFRAICTRRACIPWQFVPK